MLAISKISNVIKNAKSDRSILFIGAPGVGKSYGVLKGAKLRAQKANKKFVQYAFNHRLDTNQRLGDDLLANDLLLDIFDNPDKYFIFVDLRLTTVEPVDLQGKMEDVQIKTNRQTIEYTITKPPLWAVLLSMCEGVLFLDELLDVQRPDVKSASYQLLLDKMAGNVKFNDNVLVVAAGNNSEVSCLSSGLSLPQARRLRIFTIKPPAVKEWQAFMDETYVNKNKNYDRSVLLYLTKYKDALLKLPVEEMSGGNISDVIYKSETTEPFPTPDAWTHLALGLYTKEYEKEGVDLSEFISSYIGEQEGRTFELFYKELISIDIDEILKNPEGVNKLNWNQKAAVISQMASQINDDVQNLVKYKELLDTLVFDKSNNTVNSDYIAIFASCLKSKMPDNINIMAFSKLIPKDDLEILNNSLNRNKLLKYSTIILYLLQAIDNRYEECTVGLCDTIMKIKKGD